MDKPSKRAAAARREEKEMANAILQYLAEHPHATDTLEGIAEWWIMRQRIRVEVERLAKVLRELTKDGLLEEIEIGKDKLYRLKGRPM